MMITELLQRLLGDSYTYICVLMLNSLNIHVSSLAWANHYSFVWGTHKRKIVDWPRKTNMSDSELHPVWILVMM